MILDFVAQTRRLLAAAGRIDCVQQILRSLVPDFLNEILIEEDIGQEHRFQVDLSVNGALADYAQKELARSEEGVKEWERLLKDQHGHGFPFKRQHGWLHLVSSDASKNVHFRFDEYDLAPNVEKLQFGNSLSIESQEIGRHNYQLSQVALSVLKRMFDNDLFDHGYCCPADQYDAKNLDRTGGGVCAVGLDASKCLPGFYWGNYFGPFLCELIGEQKLQQVPGCQSHRLHSGYLVVNELPPDAWSEAAFIKNENAAMDHIGRHLFFEKGKVMDGKLFS